MRKYIAELIGTFVLTFVSCGAAAISGGIDGTLGILGIAFAFGLAIVAMAYSIGNISGCHINPAVSLGMLVTKRMSFKDFCGYVVSQVLGAIAAAFMLKTIGSMCDPQITALGTNGFGELSYVNISMMGALLVEVILTCIFVLTILGVTSKKEYSSVSGLVIGLALTFVHIIGIPLTGTSVNPARSLGPALFEGGLALSQVWIFILGPLLGALIAAFIWMCLSPSEETKPKRKKTASSK